MKQYIFPYRREYSTLIGEIHRPVATVYLQAKNKKPGYVGGITQRKIKVYVHKLNTKLGAETFKARIAFAQKEDIPPLLGRTDIFDHFKVCYNNKQKETTFTLL